MRHDPRKHRLPPFEKSGILLVDKPATWTSHDVVAFIRARFNAVKAGHCGTLDPAATGLLVVVLGRFTKLSQKFSGEDKVYDATILLGTETDSQDMDGKVVATKDCSKVTKEDFIAAAKSFEGDIMQVPPMVSAVKKDGDKLYELARKGIEVERDPKPITIRSIDISRIELPYADFTVECSKGTYIRTLCHDIGQKLSCGAVLYKLRRTRSGEFTLNDAYPLEQMKEWTQEDLANAMDNFLHQKLIRMQQFSAI